MMSNGMLKAGILNSLNMNMIHLLYMYLPLTSLARKPESDLLNSYCQEPI